MDCDWYKESILYEVDIRAFYDANADGIGDLSGLIDKLHYLRELGVTALVVGPRQHYWLGKEDSPITSKAEALDFQRFVHEAHAHRLHVVTELLVDQASEPLSAADPVNVRALFQNVIRTWLDAGVDGVKIDLAQSRSDVERTSGVKLSGAHVIVKEIRALIDRHYAERVVVVEANGSSDDLAAFFGRGDRCHVAFNMCFMPRLLMAMKHENRMGLVHALRRTMNIPASCQWTLFLRHHEEVSLEWCTDSERDEMYETYATEPPMRFNRGIRRRLAPLFENDRRRIELAYALMFSLPGSPMIYYGDEIGMGDNVYLDNCNGLRTPMQWSRERNAGFSRADPARLTIPVNGGPIYGYQVVNVDAQRRQPESLFNWMRRLIAVRRHYAAAFGYGTADFLEPSNETILAYVRCHHDEQILVVANLSCKGQSVDLALGAYAGVQPLELLGGTRVRRIGAGPYSVTVGPYECLWLLLSRRMIRPSPSSDVAAGLLGTPPLEKEAPAALTERLAVTRLAQRAE